MATYIVKGAADDAPPSGCNREPLARSVARVAVPLIQQFALSGRDGRPVIGRIHRPRHLFEAYERTLGIARGLRVSAALAVWAHPPLYYFDPIPMRGVEVIIVGRVGRDVDPLDFACIVPCLEFEQPRLFVVPVEVVGCRFHPRIVRIAWIIDVPLVDDDARLKEIVHELLVAFFRGVCIHGACLLHELALQGLRDSLALVDHTTRDGPISCVFPLDDDHLQLALARMGGVPARDDRIGSVVRAPLSKHPPHAEAGAPMGVARPLVLVHLYPRLEALALQELLYERQRKGLPFTVHLWQLWVSPALLRLQLLTHYAAIIVEDLLGGEFLWSVLFELCSPRHLRVGHFDTLR